MIDWEVGGDGWESTVVDSPQPSPPEKPETHSKRRRRFGLAMSVLVFLVIAAGISLKWRASRNLAVVRAAVQSVIDQEVWAFKSGNWELYESLLDPRSPAGWYRSQQTNFVQYSQRGPFTAEITDLALVLSDPPAAPGQSMAMTEVLVKPPGRPAYRETRVYRQVGSTWLQTAAPAGDVWLHQEVRETANLRFVYHRDVAGRLVPLMPALQKLYAQLLTDFKLAPLPGKREIKIVLSVQPASSVFADAGAWYDLSSRATASDTEGLRSALGAALAERVMRQFYADAGEMAFVLDGIRDWEVSNWSV